MILGLPVSAPATASANVDRLADIGETANLLIPERAERFDQTLSLSPANLLSPSGVTADTTPAYVFKAVPGALVYTLTVIGPVGGNTPNRTITVNAAQAGCPSGAGLCTLVLNNLTQNGIPWTLTPGSYSWVLLAQSATDAKQTAKSFQINPNNQGFNSQFNGSYGAWQPVLGVWSINSNAYLTNWNNDVSKQASIMYPSPFTNFVYETRMVRRGSSNAQGVYVRGNPYSLGAYGRWRDAYYFGYFGTGTFLVTRYQNDNVVFIKWNVASPAIAQGENWNTLRVTVFRDYAAFAINGTTVWSDSLGPDAAAQGGWVGITYRPELATDQIWVDYATLDVLSGQ